MIVVVADCWHASKAARSLARLPPQRTIVAGQMLDVAALARDTFEAPFLALALCGRHPVHSCKQARIQTKLAKCKSEQVDDFGRLLKKRRVLPKIPKPIF